MITVVIIYCIVAALVIAASITLLVAFHRQDKNKPRRPCTGGTAGRAIRMKANKKAALYWAAFLLLGSDRARSECLRLQASAVRPRALPMAAQVSPAARSWRSLATCSAVHQT